VTVAVGDEVWREVVQGITHGMKQAHGRDCLFAAARTPREGISTLLEGQAGTDVARLHSRVTDAVHAVCRELGTRL